MRRYTSAIHLEIFQDFFGGEKCFVIMMARLEFYRENRTTLG